MSAILKTLKSFKYAFQGIVYLFRYENNAGVHLIFAFAVVVTGLLLKLTSVEWSLLFIPMGLVMMAEAFNTAIEKLCDKVSPEIHPVIKTVKDLAAGGVLIAAATAVAVGLVILGPKLLEKLSL